MAAVWEKWRSENWGLKPWAFSIFLLILLLHGLAILLFTSGFLLTRTKLSHYSQCSDLAKSPCFEREEIRSQKCWTKPAVDRVLIIVLRFDFVAPSTFFEEKKPWMDKLQVLHKLASQPGSSAKIFKAIADPPTTSLQCSKFFCCTMLRNLSQLALWTTTTRIKIWRMVYCITQDLEKSVRVFPV